MNTNKKRIYKIIGTVVAVIMLGGVVIPPTMGFFGTGATRQHSYRDYLTDLEKQLQNQPDNYNLRVEKARTYLQAAKIYQEKAEHETADSYRYKSLENYKQALNSMEQKDPVIIMEKAIAYHDLNKSNKKRRAFR